MNDLLVRFLFFLNYPQNFSSTLFASWAVASLILTGEPIYRVIRFRNPQRFKFWSSIVLLQFSAGWSLNCLWHVGRRFFGALQDCRSVGATIAFPWDRPPTDGDVCSVVEMVTYGNGGMLLIVLLLLWPMYVFYLVVWGKYRFVD